MNWLRRKNITVDESKKYPLAAVPFSVGATESPLTTRTFGAENTSCIITYIYSGFIVAVMINLCDSVLNVMSSYYLISYCGS